MLKGSLLILLGERSCDNWKALLLEKKAKNARHSQKDKKRDKLLFVLLLNLISSSLNHMNKSASLHTEFGLTQPLLTLTHYCSAPVFFDSAQQSSSKGCKLTVEG